VYCHKIEHDGKAMSFNFPAQLNDRLIPPIRRGLEETRGQTLRAIASIDTGRQILTELLKPDLYAPKGNKEILMGLYRDPNGLFLGHAHGANGKIVGHARWLKVTGASSRLLNSAGMLTGQHNRTLSASAHTGKSAAITSETALSLGK
jgi:hypothetical protein